VSTDVSEEHIASIFRVEKISSALHGVIFQKMLLFKFHKDWFGHSQVDNGGYTDSMEIA
jgi:hypothetical protein